MKNHETRLRTPAAVTGLTVAEESAAARQTLRLLKTLQNALKKGLADRDDVHWVDDLTQLTPDAALFLFQTLHWMDGWRKMRKNLHRCGIMVKLW